MDTHANELTYCLWVGAAKRFFCHSQDGFINPLYGFGTAAEATKALEEWSLERTRLGLNEPWKAAGRFVAGRLQDEHGCSNI